MKTFSASNAILDFEFLFDSVPEPYLILSTDFRILWANRAYLQMTLTMRSAIVGKNVFEVFPNNPADPAANGVENLRRSLEKVVQTKQPDQLFVQQYDMRAPDGENGWGEFKKRYWSIVNTPILNQAGEIEYITNRAEDETEFVQSYLPKELDAPQTESERHSDEPLKHEFVRRARQLQQTNELLRASEARYRTLFNSIDTGFCVFDMLFDANGKAFDYRFVEVNPAFERQSGLFDAVGKTALELAPNLEKHWFEAYGNVALTGEAVRLVNGSAALRRWFDVFAFRIGENDSRRVAVLFSDVTDSKRYETALRESSDFNQNVIDSLAAHIAVLNKNGVITTVNQAWRDFAVENGGDPTLQGTGIGTNYLEVCRTDATDPNDESNNIYRGIKSVLTGAQKFFSVEYPCDSPTAKRWFLLTASPLTHDSGGVVVSHTNITGRRVAEEALRESEEKFRFLANSISQLAWMADQTGAIFWYNQRWFDYTGTTDREMHEQGWQSVAHPDEAARVVSGFQHSIESGAAWEETFRMRSANGDYRWFLSRALPIRDRNGDITRWFGTNTDVEELRQARKTAEEANRLKDEFLATVSHELRTPLNAILGWANLLRTGSLDQKGVVRAFEVIERNARVQAQLIEDLLDVSRIITGNLRLDVRPIEPASFIEAALEAVRPAAESKGVRLQKIVDTNVPTVSGDYNRLQQVVWNLLSNAVKFTERDGRVSISLMRINSHLEIHVSDTGEGIAADFLPFVFDRFRQADGTSTRRHGGLGLGLAIVRHIVELHGGAVAVESQGAGTGSTFVVKLPLVPVYQTEQNGKREHPAATENLPPLESAERLDAAKILILDDEPDARELLATVLRERGANVATYASVAEIMRALETAAPDVIVSDIEMPGADGYEFIKRLRALPFEQGGKIPAVALTAYARVEDRLRALRAGYQMHISKPVELNELIAVVASLIERAKTKF